MIREQVSMFEANFKRKQVQIYSWFETFQLIFQSKFEFKLLQMLTNLLAAWFTIFGNMSWHLAFVAN